jgi:hypothetical protein
MNKVVSITIPADCLEAVSRLQQRERNSNRTWHSRLSEKPDTAVWGPLCAITLGQKVKKDSIMQQD